MCRRKGFTLVEVMVGLVIISLAFSLLASSYLGSIRNIKAARKVNQTTYGVRTEMEKKVREAEQKIKDYGEFWDESASAWKDDTPESISKRWGATVEKPVKMYQCCGFDIYGYPVEHQKGERTLYSFVSDKYQDVKVPIIGRATLKSNGIHFHYLEEDSISLSEEYDKVTNMEELFSVQYRWYASNKVMFQGQGLGIPCLAKPYVDARDGDPLPIRRPVFNFDYTRLPEVTSGLRIETDDDHLRDRTIRCSVIPLGNNKYIGRETESSSKVHVIGVPLHKDGDGKRKMNKLLAHYDADMVIDYAPSTGAVYEVTLGGGGEWYDVREYIKKSGLKNKNYLNFKKCHLMGTDWGDYIRFDENSSGSFRPRKETVILRVKDLCQAPGEKISLLRSAGIRLVAADENKEQFELVFQNGQLVMNKRKVVKNPDDTYRYEWETPTVLIADTGKGSYANPSGSASDFQSSFQVLALVLDNCNLKKVYRYKAEYTGSLVSVNDGEEIGTDLTESVKDGSVLWGGQRDTMDVPNKGAIGISDVISYQNSDSDKAADEELMQRAGKYLVKKYIDQE